MGLCGCDAFAFTRGFFLANVSHLYCLLKRTMGRTSANIQVPDGLECRLGTATQGDEAISGPAWSQRLLVCLFCRRRTEPSYYGIPCKPLPTISTLWLNLPIEVPPSIEGPVLISASNLSGVEFGPGSLDPYGQFKQLVPTAKIEHGVFVFDGHFDVPLASALSRMQKAQNYLVTKQPEQALAEAQVAVTLAPNAVQTQMMLGDVLGAMGHAEQARSAYEKALVLAKTIEPEFQIRSIPSIEQKLESVPKVRL